jgi:hypothetical protein
MKLSRRMIVIGILSWLAMVLAIAIYVRLTFKIDVTPFAQLLNDIDRWVPTSRIDGLVREAQDGTIHWRKMDRTSVGSPKTEARLLQLHDSIYYFSLTFRQPPADIGEMSRLLTIPQMSPNEKALYQGFIRDCQIVNLRTDSYILNCDGWVPPPSEIQQLVKAFDSETEKFYSIQDHVIFFVPPPVSGKPTLTLPNKG